MMRKRSLYLGTSSMSPVERAQGRFMRAPDEHPAPAAPLDPAPVIEQTPPTFDDAFASALAEGDGGTPAAPAPAALAPAPKEPAPKEPAPKDAPAPVDPVAPVPAPTDPAPTPKAPTAEEIVAEMARTMADRSLTPPAAPAPAPAAPAPAPAPIYSEAEQGVMAEYEKNWPDVSAAEALKRRAEYSDLIGFMFKEVAKYVTPMQEQLQRMGNTIHTGELKELVPDYTPLVEADVNKWIDTQPAYLQTGMKAVMQGGTSDEVADLIGRYRAASGVAPAPAPAAPAPAAPAPAPKPAAPVAPKSELSEAAKKAAASLAPVAGERSQVPVGEDLQDFDSAFAKYAGATG